MKDALPLSGPPSPLDANAAFVVHVTGTAEANPAAISGRCEHVTTGRSTRFTSVGQLSEFIHGVLARLGPEKTGAA